MGGGIEENSKHKEEMGPSTFHWGQLRCFMLAVLCQTLHGQGRWVGGQLLWLLWAGGRSCGRCGGGGGLGGRSCPPSAAPAAAVSLFPSAQPGRGGGTAGGSCSTICSGRPPGRPLPPPPPPAGRDKVGWELGPSPQKSAPRSRRLEHGQGCKMEKTKRQSKRARTRGTKAEEPRRVRADVSVLRQSVYLWNAVSTSSDL